MSYDPYETETENHQGAFNFALATLERIHKIIVKITDISVFETGASQKAKYKLCRQLLVNSCALIRDKEREKRLLSHLNTIKLVFAPTMNRNGVNEGTEIVYSEEVDYQLDNFIMELQNDLQEDGSYFMPEKMEEMF